MRVGRVSRFLAAVGRLPEMRATVSADVCTNRRAGGR
jgi:hypothetical protein